jgi:NAD+ diphosphatase
MCSKSELAPWPALGYTPNPLDRATLRRNDPEALARLAADAAAGAYVIGGELVVLKKSHELDPLFALSQARALGELREQVFLGLANGVARFGFGFDQAAIEGLKAHPDLVVSDLRSIAVQGMVAVEHQSSSMRVGGAVVRRARPTTFRVLTPL